VNEIFALACFFTASVLVVYLALPEKTGKTDESGEVVRALEEMRSCLSSLGDPIS